MRPNSTRPRRFLAIRWARLRTLALCQIEEDWFAVGPVGESYRNAALVKPDFLALWTFAQVNLVEPCLHVATIDLDCRSFAVGYTDVIQPARFYRSDYAGTNRADAVSWPVDNINKEVEALKGKGVTFEHYDIPGLKVQGDIHVGDGIKMAWFKGPDGNILHIVEEAA